MKNDIELVKKIIPLKKIIDFDRLNGNLSSPECLKVEINKLTPNRDLPLFFPNLPDFFKAKKNGLTTNQEYIDKQLKLPPILYVSDTYNEHPELRGLMEEIIYEYENERKRHGLDTNMISERGGWSKHFRTRMRNLLFPPPGPLERELDPT